MENLVVFVWESGPHWTPELQRQFQDEDIWVRACSNIVDVVRHAESHAKQHPKATRLILLDFAAGPAECLQFLGRRIRTDSF